MVLAHFDTSLFGIHVPAGAGRDSLRSVKCAKFKISEVAVSTFKIFLGFSPECSFALLSVLIAAGILILLLHLGHKNMSQISFLHSFNFINSAHSVLLKLLTSLQMLE